MNFSYARKSFGAACLLAVRDPKAWDEFDLTTDGFFRSFAAILFVIPLNIVYDLFAIRVVEARAARAGLVDLQSVYGATEMAFSTVTLVLGWIIFSLAVLFLLRPLGLQQRYSQFIIANNWGRIVTELLNLPAILMFSLGLISDQAAIDCLFIALGLRLYYRFYIAQTALEVGWGFAMAMAILQLLLLTVFDEVTRLGAGLWLPA